MSVVIATVIDCHLTTCLLFDEACLYEIKWLLSRAHLHVLPQLKVVTASVKIPFMLCTSEKYSWKWHDLTLFTLAAITPNRMCGLNFNTLRPRQNGRYFADDIFKCIFLNENAWISLKISLKFVPKVRINNIPALVQIMAWRLPGDKPLSEPMVVRTYMRHSASMSWWKKEVASYRLGRFRICPTELMLHHHNICISWHVA